MLEGLTNYKSRDGFLRDGCKPPKILENKVRPAGLEPATPCLEVRSSQTTEDIEFSSKYQAFRFKELPLAYESL